MIIRLSRMRCLAVLIIGSVSQGLFAADVSVQSDFVWDHLQFGLEVVQFRSERTNAVSMRVFPNKNEKPESRQNYVETNVQPFRNAVYVFVDGKLSGIALSTLGGTNQEAVVSALTEVYNRRWGEPERLLHRAFTGKGTDLQTNEIALWKTQDRHSFVIATSNYIGYVTFDPSRLKLADFLPSGNTIKELEAVKSRREKNSK